MFVILDFVENFHKIHEFSHLRQYMPELASKIFNFLCRKEPAPISRLLSEIKSGES